MPDTINVHQLSLRQLLTTCEVPGIWVFITKWLRFVSPCELQKIIVIYSRSASHASPCYLGWCHSFLSWFDHLYLLGSFHLRQRLCILLLFLLNNWWNRCFSTNFYLYSVFNLLWFETHFDSSSLIHHGAKILLRFLMIPSLARRWTWFSSYTLIHILLDILHILLRSRSHYLDTGASSLCLLTFLPELFFFVWFCSFLWFWGNDYFGCLSFVWAFHDLHLTTRNRNNSLMWFQLLMNLMLLWLGWWW